ncbi:MAG: AbrB/MazE/SpoVT family DNA-binding domain-containing protein [Candidatus Eisenbacteria bacterium]|uniref:AbrB/MazE/SpoVT family DNA-binding domain-containing protein n=1 Tax=Eiseniibacteriota bacterium TaxID=2212470 RepID=A0A948RYV5_UNCEI|nr:AbrB/MazE/SpoVT family DNA-binding domain-containing protein [Candidatus Eisenbacteria bacterium]MBU1947751.1 AbrB/MazE/SpoVT family DNA-binding domain-containing protein [Candidatus Eisenbacteria bacterium]MBU2692931.1 AbrB/MazE/SpoVT family DNA-binding domain-containing protein [Candidatus Eisenbacteria bacterium]
MQEPATTKMTTKGQVVIPEDIRKKLGLKPGARFVVVGKGDVVILKAIEAPSMDEFDDLVSEARRQARRAGLNRTHVTVAVRRARSKK